MDIDYRVTLFIAKLLGIVIAIFAAGAGIGGRLWSESDRSIDGGRIVTISSDCPTQNKPTSSNFSKNIMAKNSKTIPFTMKNNADR